MKIKNLGNDKILKYGDVEDIVRLVSSCSLLISAREDDKYSIGAKDIFDYAKNAFNKRDLLIKVYRGKHVFTKEMRKEAYSF